MYPNIPSIQVLCEELLVLVAGQIPQTGRDLDQQRHLLGTSRQDLAVLGRIFGQGWPGMGAGLEADVVPMIKSFEILEPEHRCSGLFVSIISFLVSGTCRDMYLSRCVTFPFKMFQV